MKYRVLWGKTRETVSEEREFASRRLAMEFFREQAFHYWAAMQYGDKVLYHNFDKGPVQPT